MSKNDKLLLPFEGTLQCWKHLYVYKTIENENRQTEIMIFLQFQDSFLGI